MKKVIIGACAMLTVVTAISAEQMRLRYVIDGDTVVFNQATCRLLYIDTPESKRNKKATRDVANCNGVSLNDVVESGRYAKNYLKSIMRKGSSYEVSVSGKDRYNRSLCVIYSNGESINDAMVENGFAVPFWKYIKNPLVKINMIAKIRSAKTGGKGLWRTHPQVMECMN